MNALMMHGMDWTGDDLTGWWLSEKFNGCRAWWTGTQLLSRGGIEIRAPRSFLNELPGCALDCELWAGYGAFEEARQACQYGKWSEGIVLKVFDAPDYNAPDWATRINHAGDLLRKAPFAGVVRRRIAASTADAIFWMRLIQAAGGEGVMARSPALPYTPGITSKMLKLKREAQ